MKTGSFFDIKRSTKNFNKTCAKISVAILKQRISMGKNQKDFAKYMGVSQGMVSKWESGEYNFTIESISKIFDKLNLDYTFDIAEDNTGISGKIIQFTGMPAMTGVNTDKYNCVG